MQPLTINQSQVTVLMAPQHMYYREWVLPYTVQSGVKRKGLGDYSLAHGSLVYLLKELIGWILVAILLHLRKMALFWSDGGIHLWERKGKKKSMVNNNSKRYSCVHLLLCEEMHDRCVIYKYPTGCLHISVQTNSGNVRKACEVTYFLKN